MTDLDALRQEIDGIDAQLVSLIGERFHLTEKIGQYKLRHRLPAADPVREAHQMTRIADLSTANGVSSELAQAVLRLIVDNPSPPFSIHLSLHASFMTEHLPRFSTQPIRSFVLRQGRMSDAQKRYLDELLPRFGIAYQMVPLDFASTFGRNAPVVLEIGCGMGDTTATIAAAQRDTDFIGIEVHGPGVGNLCKLIEDQQLTNLRVMQHDATEVVRDMIPLSSLAGVHVYFPDPWPKKRHHKRRILQAAFVAELAARLAPGGYLHCATDWEEYADHMLEVLAAEPLLENTADSYASRPDYRPLTKFEARGLKLGHGVWDLIFRRKR